MPRSLEARVERLAGPLQRRGLAAAHHRAALRARLEVCQFVRASVREAGLDPAALSALRREAEAGAALTALGDTPALRAADEVLFASERGPDDADEPLGELVRLARLYLDGSHPAASASLAAWHAWALFRQSAAPPPTGAVFCDVESSVPRKRESRATDVSPASGPRLSRG